MIGLRIQNLDTKKVTENEREYLITLEMRKKGIKVPVKNKQFGLGNENVGYSHNINRFQKSKTTVKPRKPAVKTAVKTGLSIIGSEMEIHHALESRENKARSPATNLNSQPQNYKFPAFEELMERASLPANFKVSKNK